MTSHSHIPTTTVKLPKLVMKKFNGDFTKWATFWDSFESSVHNNSSLSDVDKFNYLNAQLEGHAPEAIAGLKLTSANYGEATAILKKRFGNKQLIITRHMDALLNTDAVEKSIQAGRCFVCLRKYHRSCECRSTMKCSKCNG